MSGDPSGNIVIRKADPSDAPLLGDIIAEAFSDDALNLWAFGSPAGMRPVFHSLARNVYVPRGFGHVAGQGEGCTLWLPPGASKGLGPLPTIALAASLFRRGGARAVKRTLALDAFMQKSKPQEPHYYLFAIGVRRNRRGQGLGGRLIDPALARCDAEGVPAYLENTKKANLGFYRSRGFEVTRQVTPVRGAPPLWLMWRRPGGGGVKP